MKLRDRIFSRETAGADVLRLALCVIPFVHGCNRLMRGEAPVLGQMLQDEGIPASLITAYFICFMETVGTALMAARLLVWPVSFTLAFIYFVGILMFNLRNGFFVVGAGDGGWEYNALLIVCLLVVAWENREHRYY